MTLLFFSSSKEEPQARPRWRTFWRSLMDIVRIRNTWVMVGIACLGGAAVTLMNNLLLNQALRPMDDSGYNVYHIFYAILGVLLGGFLSDRLGRRSSLAIGLGLLATVASVKAVSIGILNPDASASLLFTLTVYGAIGWVSTSAFALFMDHCDRRLAATMICAFIGAFSATPSVMRTVYVRLAMDSGLPILLWGVSGRRWAERC